MQTPVFVKIKKYKELTTTLQEVDNKLAHIKQIMSTIEQFKKEEDTQLQKWQENVQNVQQRVTSVLNSLQK